MRQLYIGLIVFLIMTVTYGQTQTAFKYGAELGLAISKFPKNQLFDNGDNRKIRMTSSPLYSPLFGVTTNLIIKKYFQFTAGLQYQMIGVRSYDHNYGYDYVYNGNYSFETWENQTFHKICLPLTVGLTFKIWELQPSLFVGYRPNYFLTGKYYRKSVYIPTDNAPDTIIEYEFNPYDNKKLESPIRQRFDRQFLYGFSTSIGQHFKITLTIYSGRMFLYSESAITCLPYGFRNNDYTVSISYLFSTARKKHDTCNGVK